MTKLDDIFQRLCHEAVLACGADLPAVQAYVAGRIEHMDPVSRAAIERDLHRVLAFQAPSAPATQLH